MIALPCSKKGFTGDWVAEKMLKYWWRPFGIPSVISSDRGSHFVNAWWETLCARLGLRQAFSQAYHHQANGRVEMAGQQILERLRKLNTPEPINWVEALPLVLDRYHDTPGESGLSPYQILFGRERSLGNLPYETPKECEDAQDFFERMEKVDEEVARVLNAKHARQTLWLNAGRQKMHIFSVGDTVWYLRPPGTGTKLSTRWLGPCKVVARTGESSYEIRVSPSRTMAAHATFLKPHTEDKFVGEPVSRYFHKRTRVEPKLVPEP
jgi:hypothetical protein